MADPGSADLDPVEHKFIKSRLNARTERRAHDFVLLDRRFQKPNTATKRKILELLEAEGNFTHHSFDLVMTSRPVEELTPANVGRYIDEITVVEVKSTRKAIANKALNGFFFGSSETQYVLAEELGDRCKWVFVVLNDDNDYGKPFFTVLNFDEVRERTRNKRVQFQVNFRTDMNVKPRPQSGPFPDPEFMSQTETREDHE